MPGNPFTQAFIDPTNPIGQTKLENTETVDYKIPRVDHGVEVNETADVPTEYDPRKDHPDYTPLAAEPDPVPVRIVHSGKRERKAFRTHRSYVNNNVSRILGENENTTTVTIFNLGTVTLYIGDNEGNANPMFGYPVLANSSVQFHADRAVYASSADGSQQPVAVLQEYVIEV